MSRPFWSWLGAAGAIVAVAVVARSVVPSSTPVAEVVAAPKVTAALPSPAPVARPVVVAAPARAPRFEPSRELAYRVTSEATTTLAGVPVGGERDLSISLSIQGTWHLRPLRETARGTIAVAQLADLEVRGPGLSVEALQRPFLVEVGADGRLLRFARSTASPMAEARQQQAIVWEALFSTNTDAAFAGENGSGAFEATLTVRDEGRELERSLTSWKERWDGASLDERAQGVLVVQRSGSGWFDLAQSRQKVAGGETRFEARRIEASAVLSGDVRETDFVWEDLLPRATRRRLGNPVTKADLARRARVAPLPLETVMKDFDERAAGKGYIAESWKDLSAYFEVHPEAIAASFARLKAKQMPATSVAVFYTAVGKARTPVAKDALLAVRRDPKEFPMDRVRATLNLIDRDDVGLEYAKELAIEGLSTPPENTHASRFLRGEALLALSMMSGLRGEPEVGTVTNETLRRLLVDRTLPVPVMRAVLKSVGNTGDPTLLPDVVEPSKHTNLHVRLAAAHAFRRMPVKDAEAMELEWLKREPDRFVKSELYGVIRSQHLDARVGASEAMTRQALADLKSTKSPLDRRTLIRFIAQGSMAHDPQVRAALLEQARYEYLHDSSALNEFTDVLSNEEVSEVLK